MIEEGTKNARYQLVANISHEGKEESGFYKIHVRAKDKWFVMQDLFVEEIMAPMVVLSESVVQFWERCD